MSMNLDFSSLIAGEARRQVILHIRITDPCSGTVLSTKDTSDVSLLLHSYHPGVNHQQVSQHSLSLLDNDNVFKCHN